MNAFEYFKPDTLVEARDILLNYGENAHILNGGTDLIIRMRDKITEPSVVVDIKDICELRKIEVDKYNNLFIGACVTLNEVAHHNFIQKTYDFLSRSAHEVGSMQVRNRATMVGNICNASPLADTATPLLTLDASLIIWGADGEKEISIHDFFLGVRKTCLKPGEIVKGIKISSLPHSVIGSFHKMSRRSKVDLSTVCGTVLRDDKKVSIALGAVAPTPIRAKKTEKFLQGKELTDEVIKNAELLAASEAAPIDDVRSSREYRLEMVKVIVRRGLKEIRGKGGVC